MRVEFSLAEFARTQQQLRAALGLSEERFSLAQLVGMLSDEIERMRRAGGSDVEIAAMISTASGKPVTAQDISEYYATAEQRRRAG